MSVQRDMTEKQFWDACERHGIAALPDSLGYHRVTGEPGQGGTMVRARNAGTRRRSQLAYLIKEQARIMECDRLREKYSAALESLVGKRQKGDPGYHARAGSIHINRMELSVAEAAAVINALREVRKS